jgi:hypothetical protein
MAGDTGVPTGLSPTPGVDYSIPLPYAVPDIATNRVGYYFAASTLGDAYRKAVAGDANQYAWIQAGATLPDSTFASAFAEVPGQLTTEMMRSWFRAALAALDSPGGSSFQGTITVMPTGAVSIDTAPKGTSAPTATAPAPAELLTKDVSAAVVTGQVVGEDGLPTMAPATSGAMPKWLWWAVGIVGALLLFSFLRKRG